jgi:4-amino-4-deoxy-L-arabinose transferase-like glycosyltransferase
MNARQALVILIAGTAAIRLLCAVSLGLGNDEAYHSLYAAHPALSYFDHPPMMAWVEMAGLTLSGGTTSAWALRIGFIVLFAGSTLILARMTSRYYGATAGFLAALALNLTGYYGLAASMFALPDGPLLFFWLLTLDRLSLAVDERGDGRPDETGSAGEGASGGRGSVRAGIRKRRGRNLALPNMTLYWIQAGLAWGGAMLSKYHAIFIPMGVALLLLLDAKRRRRLLQPGPYLAMAIGLAMFSPVLIWNARHGWVSFLFQGGRAVGGWVPRPDHLAVAVLAQAGYLFPWIWIPLVIVLVRGWRGWSTHPEGPERLWLCVATLPLTAFTAVACFRPVLPHWGLIGLVPLFPMLGRAWAGRIADRPAPVRRRLTAYAGLSLTLIVLATLEYRTGWFQRGGTAPVGILDAQKDPTVDLYGWDEVAGRIRQLGLIDDPATFVFTRYWYQSAQLAYALGPDRPTLCYNADDPRGFAFWSRPEDWIGRTGVLVLVGNDPDVIAQYFARDYFAGVEPISDFWVQRNGKPVRRIRLYRCNQQRIAYPFAIDRGHQLARHESPAGKADSTTR